jgi:hypothetical protein
MSIKQILGDELECCLKARDADLMSVPSRKHGLSESYVQKTYIVGSLDVQISLDFKETRMSFLTPASFSKNGKRQDSM